MLGPLASEVAAALLNRLLEREVWAREKLAPYAGRVAQIDVPPLTVRLGITGEGTFIVGSGEPQVQIQIDTAQLPLAPFDSQALKRNLRLTGDAEFAQALAAVLERLRPEPEEELARLVGDAVAVRLVDLLRALLQALRQGGARLARATADYWVTEQPLLVGRAEAEAFASDVTALRDDVERLQKRIERLERAQW
ncbi:MAG: SCP2 sterol-binding domain-containing protein [Sutterellaceae bacterium]|nr:SCP2 sterol-binding domain-containing protein [Burkholderiaceae bacterium]MCX7900697.1 SCP2 sterol-binding domain-containing protein [Burkholderiaceae bacterium]MDW8429713.1 SCP2 sterol-binding domain-containing protein [Sutterellaceae bacterium]